MFRAFTNFILFSSLYVAICALLLIWQTYALFHLHPVNTAFYYFAFFSTICSYNFHWYLTPADYSASHRILWNVRNRNLQLALSILGAIGAAITFWELRSFWPELGGAAFLTFLYSAPKIPLRPFIWLRKIAIGKTIFLTAVWVYVTTLMPVFLSGQAFSRDIILFIIHRFFLIYALCILFDYRDVESDKQEGIRSLITWLNHKGLMWLYRAALVIAGITAASLYPAHGMLISGFLLAPVIITAILTNYTLRTRSDYYYYFVLDGLVMLAALLHFISGLT